MATGKQVRLVKRAAHLDSQGSPADESGKTGNNSGRMPERDAAAVVTGRVRELRRKKAAEATRAFGSLFGNAG